MHDGSDRGRFRRMAAREALLFALLGSAGGCGAGPTATRDAVPAVNSAALCTRRVLFGHQSVGANLLDGLESLSREQGWSGLRIVDLGASGIEASAITHFRVGRNGDARSKVVSFERTLRSVAASPPDLAGFKFCFTDFDRSTDVEAVFRSYREALDRLSRDFPSVRFFHLTVPMVRDDSFPRVIVKRVVGKVTAQDVNRVRARFNRLLLEAYGPAVFDLATAENEGVHDRESPSLAAGYTDDGEHLNAAGKRVVGGRFAAFLAGLAEAGGVPR